MKKIQLPLAKYNAIQISSALGATNVQEVSEKLGTKVNPTMSADRNILFKHWQKSNKAKCFYRSFAVAC